MIAKHHEEISSGLNSITDINAIVITILMYEHYELMSMVFQT